MTVPINRSVSKGMRNTEHLWSQQIIKIIETSCIENSDRVACNTINRLLHREGSDQALKLRTITDLCDRHGKEVEEYQEKAARHTLQKNGFDPETGHLEEGTNLPVGVLLSSEAAGVFEDADERVRNIIESINEKREGKEKIPENSQKPYNVELPDEAVVMVSLDGVLSKRQKEHRTKSGNHEDETVQKNTLSKKRPAVETSVAHIEVNEKRYILTAHDMRTLCIRVLAFLLDSGLLVNRQLIIFSDGATEIKSSVDEIFSFCRHCIVLDWFHLKKRCYEILSMTLKSGKSNREMRHTVMRNLLRILWVGNVEGACQYLAELPSKWIKSGDKQQELISYLQRKESIIACYALRSRLGLRISSNPVEKANDLTVSTRQKHQGMSWSSHGSWHFAALTALYLNHEEDSWHKSASLSFKMVPVFRQKSGHSTAAA